MITYWKYIKSDLSRDKHDCVGISGFVVDVKRITLIALDRRFG